MAADPIHTLADAHAAKLARELENAVAAYVAAIDVASLASALDDTDPDHIRDQLTLILDLGDDDYPTDLDLPFGDIIGALATLAGAIAALAASQARHTLNPNSATLRASNAAAGAFITTFRTDTANSLRIAIDRAIDGSGTPYSRAAQLRRAIGLSTKQAATLETMRSALQTYLNAPRVLVPARTDNTGKRIPATFVRKIDTRAIIAATRGHLSAAQTRMLAKALGNPTLKPADADALLDRHATALRNYRASATIAEGIHGLAEQAKLTGWSIAQRFGALPADQRRFWQTAGDERVRHSHSQVATMNATGVLLAEPFATPFGPRMSPPLEWGCRCRAKLGQGA